MVPSEGADFSGIVTFLLVVFWGAYVRFDVIVFFSLAEYIV